MPLARKRILFAPLTLFLLVSIIWLLPTVPAWAEEDIQTQEKTQASDQLPGASIPLIDTAGEKQRSGENSNKEQVNAESSKKESLLAASSQSQLVAQEDPAPFKAEDLSSLELTATYDGITYRSFKSEEDGATYLYLPTGVSLSKLPIDTSASINAVSPSATIASSWHSFIVSSQGDYTLKSGTYSALAKILISDLPGVSFSLKDVTLEQINAGTKDIKYQDNTVKVINTDGSTITDSATELKGRGNFSWGLEKKGYQFKLSKGNEKDLLGMGKAKTWLLIASHGDASLMRNKLILDLAQSIGMTCSPQAEFIDLWIDGAYLGNYILCEKVQIDPQRVALSQEDALIVEMDNNYYMYESLWYTSPNSNAHFVLKDSKNSATEKDSFYNFMSSLMRFEELLYADTPNWALISALIDARSFAQYYLINELAANADACRSSMFFYRDGVKDVIHMGPVWDFDLAVGNCNTDTFGGNPTSYYLKNIKNYEKSNSAKSLDWFARLMIIPEFRNIVYDMYTSTKTSCFDKALPLLNSYEKKIQKSANANFARWSILGKENIFGAYRAHSYAPSWGEEAVYLEQWLTKRLSFFELAMKGDVISYTTHVQNIGWQSYAVDTAMAGTEGLALRLEGIIIRLNPTLAALGTIEYQTHVQNLGWEQGWVTNGQMSGTEGKAYRLEAIRIRLTGELANLYDIYYKVHAQTYGWLGWVCNGADAGTTGQALRLEGIRIVLLPKGSQPPGALDKGALADARVRYRTHVQNDGWQNTVADGDMAGTEGRRLRLESIEISLSDGLAALGNIEYRTHIQDIGWESGWKSNGAASGTSGRALRLEAIEIRLTGKLAELYDVYYQVHAQNFGWLDWACNGASAGTAGYAYRLEGIRIELVEKGTPPKSEGGLAFYKK